MNDQDIRLWLDDVRPMPPSFNYWAKTAKEAIEILKTGRVVEISLDHDLGQDASSYVSPETGYKSGVKPQSTG